MIRCGIVVLSTKVFGSSYRYFGYCLILLTLVKGVRGVKNKFLAFLKDESGQTSTEYILLVAVVAMIVLKFKNVATGKLDELTSNVFSKANSIIE